MLQAGYVLCCRCGHATDEAYYYNGDLNMWVQLVKLPKDGGWTIHRYVPEYMKKQTPTSGAPVDRAMLVTRVEEILPHRITVNCQVAGKEVETTFTHSCPFCVGKKPEWNSVSEMLPGMGNLPIYVIGVIGARTVGKSCWIHALSNPANLVNVNYLRIGDNDEYGYLLSTAEVTEAADHPPQATPVNALGKTRMMSVILRKGMQRTDVAQILVLDFAGELFARENAGRYNDTVAPLFRGTVGYSGVDAVVFMMDHKNDDERYSLAETYNRVNAELKLLEQKPVAFVMNKVDKLFDNPPTCEVEAGTQRVEIPLLTEDTFCRQGRGMYSREQILPRVTLETMILKQMKPLVARATTENHSAGFLVKATTPYVADGVDMLDFEDSINVMDPLLWILNELDIFPIEINR